MLTLHVLLLMIFNTNTALSPTDDILTLHVPPTDDIINTACNTPCPTDDVLTLHVLLLMIF